MPFKPKTHLELLRKNSPAQSTIHRDRGTAAQRGYGWEWQKAREQYLAHNPLCLHCRDEGRTTAATVVDHIIPHRGSQILFWDVKNWQPLCKPHHDKKTAAGE